MFLFLVISDQWSKPKKTMLNELKKYNNEAVQSTMIKLYITFVHLNAHNTFTQSLCLVKNKNLHKVCSHPEYIDFNI